MNLTTTKQTLLPPLTLCASVADRRDGQLTACVHLAAAGDRVTLTALDHTTTVRQHATATVAEDGAAAVPARALLSVVRGLPDAQPVTLRHDGKRLVVTCGRSRYELATLPADEYPEPADPAGDGVPAPWLPVALDRVMHAVGQDDSRPGICGVLVSPQGVVATDGHRLSWAAGGDLPACTVPRSSLAALRAVLGPRGADVDVRESRLTVMHDKGWNDEGWLSLATVPAAFPDWTRVVPDVDRAAAVEIDRAALIAVVRRLEAFGRMARGEPMLRLTLDPAAGELGLSVVAPTGEEASDGIETGMAGPEAPRLRIGLNPRYLLDALATLEGDVVLMQARDQISPVLLYGADGGDSQRHVLMPMRL